jgi:tetratricopeptide (TPR) repeat protein
MCFWGEAFALGPNINQPMLPESEAPAHAAARAALARIDGVSPRERALIEAVAARYAPAGEGDRAALDRAYAEAMGAAHAAFPDDHEIAVLYAEALMNLQPWDYWEADKLTPRGRAGEAIAVVEGVLAENPDHPAAIHLYIHLVEASADPERAEPYADRLAGQMPGAGHIVHMPSHLYYRVGRYADSLEANVEAVAVDRAYLADNPIGGIYQYGYYPHNIHFVVASAGMAGDARTAYAHAEMLAEAIPAEMARQTPWVQVILAAPYFNHALFGERERTLAVPAPEADLPYVRAMWHYMRAVTYAREGDVQATVAEARAIDRINREHDFGDMIAGGVPAPDLLRLALHVIEGRLATARGERARAIDAFDRAVDIQDALPYMEPPYWYYPVRQSLGAALLAAGQPEEAEAVFWQSLLNYPNNGWALYGLATAHRAQGESRAAAYTEQLLDRAWAGDPDLLALDRL